EGLDIEQRAPRKAGWNVGIRVRAPRERAQSVLERQRPGRREEPHFDQVAAGNVSLRQCLQDLRAGSASVLCFPHSSFRGFTWKVHSHLSLSNGCGPADGERLPPSSQPQRSSEGAPLVVDLSAPDVVSPAGRCAKRYPTVLTGYARSR